MNVKQVYEPKVYEPVNSDEVVVAKDDNMYINNPFRAVRLEKGDEVYISRDVYKVKLGKYIPDTPLMCIKLHRRDKWWQFWKPRYKGASYRMMTD